MRNEFLQLQIPLPVALVGLGVSGHATRQLLLSLGVDAHEILTFDQKSPADYSDPELLLSKGNPRSLCVSPGVPLNQAWIQNAVKAGVRLTSEMEISFSFLTTEKTIAVTGSVGKSTTTSALGAGAAVADPLVFVGGNLGTPLAHYSRDLIEGKRGRAQHVILELSSYQLENFRNLKAEVSVLTSLNPNHLERYRDLSEYYSTKLKIFSHTKNAGILNRNGGDIEKHSAEIQSRNPDLSWIVTDRESPKFKNRLVEKPFLVGSHNLDNLAMCFAVADLLQWPEESYQAMLRFPGLPHRLENCGLFSQVLFLNDSKATTIDSVLQAVRSVREEYPERKIWLLVGGKDKNLPWHQLGVLGSDGALCFLFFGEVAERAQQQSSLPGISRSSLSAVLSALKSQLKSGDIVLLSPGGTSLDEFKNFEERGSFFKNWVLSEFQNR